MSCYDPLRKQVLSSCLLRCPDPGRGAPDPVWQICEGINYMHSLNVSHNDFKPANVFYTHHADGTLCPLISDFGTCTVFDANGHTLQGQCRFYSSTPAIVAPELERAMYAQNLLSVAASVDMRLADVHSVALTLCFLTLASYDAARVPLLAHLRVPALALASQVVAAGANVPLRKQLYDQLLSALGARRAGTPHPQAPPLQQRFVHRPHVQPPQQQQQERERPLYAPHQRPVGRPHAPPLLHPQHSQAIWV